MIDAYEYYASRKWKLKGQAVRIRSKGKCERCHYGPHEETHHLTYRRFGDEPLSDLLGVCRPCHRYLSGKSDFDPVRARPFAQLPLNFN